MSFKNTDRYNELKEAMDALKELNVPEALQNTALEHLLNTGTKVSAIATKPSMLLADQPVVPLGNDLRTFVSEAKPKNAVAEIPTLIYWAHHYEDKEMVDEKSVIELYRRAGLRPPKNVMQSLRDLASKKYGRLEAVDGYAGYVKLSRVGEDFVIHDVIGKKDN